MIPGDAEPNQVADHHILDWLQGSDSYFPTFLDDPYNSDDYLWWDPNHQQDIISHDVSLAYSNSTTTESTGAGASMTTTPTTTPSNPPSPDQKLKRKSPEKTIPMASPDQKAVRPGPARKPSAGKRAAGKLAGRDCSSGNNGKDGRWAEQLLNPCAAAITAGNVSRVQHLLYVLHELASASGDPNHRLAFHGLRALTHHLSAATVNPSRASISSEAPATFASSEPRFFRKSLLNFNEHSPWFALPSNIANSSILQIYGDMSSSGNLHIVDIGVSHGAQWPTLLDGLSRSPSGPPSLVRLTIIPPTTENDSATPFSLGPMGYDYSTLLLDFAKRININLQIDRLHNLPLHNLSPESIGASQAETLIVSAQFRLHHLNHTVPDDRTTFLKTLRGLNPTAVILTENNSECGCENCAGDFATGFSRRVEYLWKFLDSASSTYKGRESGERRMMEGEASKALFNGAGMNEGKEKWCARMRAAGFSVERFGDDVADGARALLRKHDGNWELRVEEDKDRCLSLWWKGQPVSFCSLWKLGG